MNIARIFTKSIGSVVLAGAMLVAPVAAHARIFLSVGNAPPVIPVYSQSLCPGDGYLWTPGYWAYGDDGYFWVDGAWVEPPYAGALWTPGYWGFADNAYLWNAGYWGSTVGYYGGLNYGFGYFGTGFYGGYWGGGHFFYNSGYNNIGGNIHNIYNRPVAGVPVHPGGAGFSRSGFDANRGSFSNDRPGASNGPVENHGPANGFVSNSGVRPAATSGGQGFANNGNRGLANNGGQAAPSGNTGWAGTNFTQNHSAYTGGQQFANGGASTHSFAQPSPAAPASSFAGQPHGGYTGGSGSYAGNAGGGGFHGGGSGGGFHGGGGGGRR